MRLQEHDDAEVEEIYDDYRCTTFLLVLRLQHQLGGQPELGCCLRYRLADITCVCTCVKLLSGMWCLAPASPAAKH